MDRSKAHAEMPDVADRDLVGVKHPPPAGVPAAKAPELPVEDEEIVRRVLGGELAAFEVIMRRYNQRIFRAVRSIVGNDDEAEDVVQETYVRAYEHLGQFARRAKFSTWLTKISIHEALARRRRLARVEIVDLGAPENVDMLPHSDDPKADHELGMQELGPVLTEAVDALPDSLRTVFTLRIVEELGTDETAACLELSVENVKVRLHRARVLLRREIDARLGVAVRELYQFGGARCDRIVAAVLSRLAEN